MTYLQLDDAFVKFANFHVKEQRFKRPSEVFFALEKTNLLLTTGRESHNTLQQENLYWSEREALDCQSGFISEEEAHQKNGEFFVSTRLISVLERELWIRNHSSIPFISCLKVGFTGLS